MATPIRQIIKNRVASTLLTVTVANGYHQTINEVWTDQKGQLNIKGFPAVSIVDRGDQDKRLAQGIYEARMLLELRTVIEDFDRATRETELAQLAADVQKAVMTQQTAPLNVWGGYAVQTLLQSADLHTSDAMDPYGVLFLMIEILYRTPENDPYVVAMI